MKNEELIMKKELLYKYKKRQNMPRNAVALNP